MYKFLITIGLTLGVAAASAQTIPASYIDHMLETHPALKAGEEAVDAQQSRALEFNTLPQPQVNVGIGVLPVETRLGPQLGRISLTQMFPVGGTRQAKTDMGLAEAGLILERTVVREYQLIADLQDAWIRIVDANANQRILLEHLDLLQSMERIALKKMETGTGKMADVLEIQMEQEEVKSVLEQWEIRKDGEEKQINLLAGFLPGSEVVAPDSFRVPSDLPGMGEPENHSALEMLHYRENMTKARGTLSDAVGKPQFGVGLTYIYTDKRQDAAPAGNGRDALMPTFSMSIPIYRKSLIHGEGAERHDLAALDLEREALKNKWEVLAAEMQAQFDATFQNLELYQKQLMKLHQIHRIHLEAYATGKGDFEEVLRMERMLLDLKLKKERALVDLHRIRNRYYQVFELQEVNK